MTFTDRNSILLNKIKEKWENQKLETQMSHSFHVNIFFHLLLFTLYFIAKNQLKKWEFTIQKTIETISW